MPRSRARRSVLSSWLLLAGLNPMACKSDTGCHGRAPTEPAARASSAATHSPALPRPAVKKTAALVLSAVPEQASATWTIVASSPKLAIEAKLVTVSEATLCGVVTSEELSGLRRNADVIDAILVTCSASQKFSIVVENGLLRLDDQQHPIPRGVEVVLPSKLRQPPPTPCPADTARSEVRVRLVHQRLESPKTDDQPYLMLLRAGSEVLPLRPLEDYPMGCASDRVFPKSTQLKAACTYTEAGFQIRAFVESERDLWVEEFRTGYHDPEPKYRFGRRLPCGSDVRFLAFDLVHGGWKPSFLGPCRRACMTRQEHCEDRCYARHADDRGTPKTGFFPCKNACVDAYLTCQNACVAAGQ